jgi:outer membrane lipoprotein LolB
LSPARRLAGIALVALLAACARPGPPTPPPVADAARLAALDRWEARGRLAVRQVGPGASGGQAGLEWRQQGALTAVSLRGPFGTGGYEIESGPDGVTLRTAAGETVERVADARAAEAWLAAAAGFAFPVASARWWLLGLPDPDRPAEARRDGDGRLLQLRQDGWDVDYAEYRATGGLWLPRRLTLATTQPATGAAVRVRVVIDRWLLDTAARPIRQ